MLVTKTEADSGKLKFVSFRAEESEKNIDEFRQKVKAWVKSNLPGMTMEQFFSRLVSLANDQIVLNME